MRFYRLSQTACRNSLLLAPHQDRYVLSPFYIHMIQRHATRAQCEMLCVCIMLTSPHARCLVAMTYVLEAVHHGW